MDLKEFVSETLTQITEGVKGAQEAVKDTGGKINPELFGNESALASQGVVQTGTGCTTTMVEFDVALTVTEGSGAKAGIGVFSGAVNLGAGGKLKSENMSVSRVCFKVPVSFPELSEKSSNLDSRS